MFHAYFPSLDEKRVWSSLCSRYKKGPASGAVQAEPARLLCLLIPRVMADAENKSVLITFVMDGRTG